MIAFITWLRCLAALLITNAHYVGIYPTDLIANGGLIGDIVFFCVSGYCLTNLRTGFFKWYRKRLSRILPVVILISIVYLLLGEYDFAFYAKGTETTPLFVLLSAIGVTYPKWLSWFVYPTYYHFVASILILYIPYYFILKNQFTKTHLPLVMCIVFLGYLSAYCFGFDKTFYHIDTVREPFIRFLFLESMLLGAWFKLNDAKLRNTGNSFVFALGALASFAAYFISKIAFSRMAGSLLSLQIFNQLIIFALLYFIMRWFSSTDRALEQTPRWLSSPVHFIAKLTLEIYLVQYVLIDLVVGMQLFFPLNWILLTSIIVLSAWILHMVSDFITSGFQKAIKR